jgi:hypothetical protein
MIFDSDDFGCNHEISDMCQSHDCRDVLLELKKINPDFKATLFAIPGEMTAELLNWCGNNRSWIELAVHGLYHTSNYECEKMSYEDFDELMSDVAFEEMFDSFFVSGFKAPGWQISDGVYEWLKDNDWWVADQPYNDERRPESLRTYKLGPESVHTHTWNCVGNGVYELFPQLSKQVAEAKEFKFVSECV